MAKPRFPFFSFSARGTIARAITLRRRGQLEIAGITPFPKDAKTADQLSWRTMYQACAALWHTLSPEEQSTWESSARVKHMTGFALWQSQCLRPNPGIYLPLAGGIMQGDITMNSHKILILPEPSTDQDPATKHYVDSLFEPPDYPMNLKPSISRWVLPGWYAHWYGTTGFLSNNIYYIPIFVSETTTFIRIGIYVATPSPGTADLRIFSWQDGLPYSLILSAGTVDTGTEGAKELTISQVLTRGYYFLAIRCSNIPSLRGPEQSYPIVAPVQGISTSLVGYTPNLIPYVNSVYSDPAPAPSSITTARYATVFLREN